MNCVLVIVSFLSLSAFADSAIQAKAEAMAKGFQGAFLLASEGKILASKGLGLANKVSGEKNGVTTSFRMASITKPFTGIAIMQLVEEGLIKVTDTVDKFLPDYGPNGSKIQIHHLLTHSSGIRDYTEWVNQTDSPQALIDAFKLRPLKFKPGARFNYSNSNFALLGYIVAKMSGIPYDRYIAEKIFIPAGMVDSGFEFPKHPGAGFACPSGGNPNGWWEDSNVAYASGALWASVTDMFRFNNALYDGTFLKPATVKRMQTRQFADWGYAFQIEADGVSHNGSLEGFTSQLYSLPDTRGLVIVFSNGKIDAYPLAERLKTLLP